MGWSQRPGDESPTAIHTEDKREEHGMVALRHDEPSQGTPPDATPATLPAGRFRRTNGRGRQLRDGALYVAGPAVFLALWEYVGRAKLLGNGLFPAFSSVAQALAEWITGHGGTPTLYSGTWLNHVLVSTGRILVGFAIGTVLAVVLGVVVGRFPAATKLLDPTVNALRPISVTAWIPLALIIFGIGNSPAFFLTALATFFPIYVNTVDGVRFADSKFTRAARMLGASEFQVLRRVVLPAALPSIITGLRVGMAIAWTTVIVTEALGAKSGIGYVLMDTYNQFLFSYVIAAMVTVGLLGFACDRLIDLLSRRPLRWVTSKGGGR
jgi:NitT/TauT family transport system permease protein